MSCLIASYNETYDNNWNKDVLETLTMSFENGNVLNKFDFQENTFNFKLVLFLKE